MKTETLRRFAIAGLAALSLLTIPFGVYFGSLGLRGVLPPAVAMAVHLFRRH